MTELIVLLFVLILITVKGNFKKHILIRYNYKTMNNLTYILEN